MPNRYFRDLYCGLFRSFSSGPSTGISSRWRWFRIDGHGEVVMSRVQLAIDQIVFARTYTFGLLDQTPAADWFRQIPGGISHIGWQVGHLAFAEYRLALWRIRGQQPGDDAL